MPFPHRPVTPDDPHENTATLYSSQTAQGSYIFHINNVRDMLKGREFTFLDYHTPSLCVPNCNTLK